MAGNDTHVTGIVADTSSAPVEGVTVILKKSDDTEKPKEYKTKTDSKGSFKFDNIEPGSYDVSCEKKDLHCPEDSLQIEKKQSRTLFLVLGAVKKDEMTGKMIHIKTVDPKTARVFIAFTALEMKSPKTDTIANPSKAADVPYGTLPEMGGILYGGSQSQANQLPDPYSPASNTLLSMYSDSISLLDVKNKEIVGSIPTAGSPIWLTFSPDGTRFWAIDSLHNLTMYSGKGDEMANVNVGDNLVTDMAVTGRGDRLYLAVRTWPTPEVMAVDGGNAIVSTLDLPENHGQPGGIAVTPDGQMVLVTMSQKTKGYLMILDPKTEKVTGEIPVGKEPMGVAVTPDGKWAVVANYGGATVDVVDLKTGSVKSELQTGLQPVRVVISPDGKTAYVTNREDDSVSAIDVLTGSQVAKTKVGKGPMALALSRDGKTLYVVNHDSANVTILDTRTFTILASTSPVKGVQAFGIAIKPEGAGETASDSTQSEHSKKKR